MDLGAGNNKLDSRQFHQHRIVANVETIIGGTGNDTVTLTTPLTPAMSVDLGAGSNELTLANGGNSGTISNVSTLIGGNGDNSVRMGRHGERSMDLGGGTTTR